MIVNFWNSLNRLRNYSKNKVRVKFRPEVYQLFEVCLAAD